MTRKKLLKKFIELLKEDYGADCKTKDWDDFDDVNKDINGLSRCASCCASQVIQWVKNEYNDVLEVEYKCVNGHDKCNEMLPSPDCPYCEPK